MRGTPFFVAVLSCACSWHSTIEGPAVPSSFTHQPASELLEVVDRDFARTEIDATSTLTIYFRGGGFTDALGAGSLCHGPLGIYTGDDCASARLIARWNEIERIDIKGFDAAASLFAGMGIAVGSVVALTIALVLRAPSPPAYAMVRQRRDEDVQPLTVQPSNVTSRAELTPLFTDNARRRAIVTGLVASDGGACLYTSGFTGAFYAGVRLASFVELRGGVRWIVDWSTTGATPSTLDPASSGLKWVAVAGLGFHAELPRLRWLAFYLGFEGGSGDVPLLLSVRPGLRFSFVRELAIGVYPLSPTLVGGDKPGVPKGIQVPTSVEVSAAF